MPSIPRKGKRALYVELSEELDERLRAYCDRVGSKVADEVRSALRRHLDSPPTLTVSPLPPLSTPSSPPAKPIKAKKKPRAK